MHHRHLLLCTKMVTNVVYICLLGDRISVHKLLISSVYMKIKSGVPEVCHQFHLDTLWF